MFTNIPQDFQSLYSELQYRFETDSSADITFNIKDSESDELLGVKKFYSSADSLLNISPIIRPFVTCATPTCQSGFVAQPNQGCVSVVVEACDDNSTIATSQPRTLSLSQNTECCDTFLTTFEPHRLISLGESDMMSVVVRPEYEVQAEVVTYTQSSLGDYESADISAFTTIPDATCVVAFNLHVDSVLTEDFEPISKMVVSITQQGRELAAVNYYVVEKSCGAVRVAWVSSRGAVEHYTFAEVVACEQRLGACELRLASAFETYQVRAAIAEMVVSPQVWLCTEDGYLPVEVVSESVDTAPLNEIEVVEIALRYKK